jgi:hypothetical protein
VRDVFGARSVSVGPLGHVGLDGVRVRVIVGVLGGLDFLERESVEEKERKRKGMVWGIEVVVEVEVES